MVERSTIDFGVRNTARRIHDLDLDKEQYYILSLRKIDSRLLFSFWFVPLNFIGYVDRVVVIDRERFFFILIYR
jgi:hypothetical protein